jgi:hypothetical protein
MRQTMDPLAILRGKLAGHPELVQGDARGGLRIEAPTKTGFAIELRADVHGWTVELGEAGFHDDFSSAEEVLEFVAWCYSGAARLREVWRGNSPVRSALEAKENGTWREVSATVFIFIPFWRKRREVILTNPNLLKS